MIKLLNFDFNAFVKTFIEILLNYSCFVSSKLK